MLDHAVRKDGTGVPEERHPRPLRTVPAASAAGTCRPRRWPVSTTIQ